MVSKLLIVFSIGLICHCAGANIKIRVNSDGSGELFLYQKKIEKSSQLKNFGTGLKPIGEVELKFKERSYRFSNLYTILPPGFRFLKWEEEGVLSTYLVIDTSANSPLLSALEIRRSEIQELVEEGKNHDDLLRFNTLVEYIQFEVEFSDAVRTVKFTEPRKPGEWTARLDSETKMIVNLPLQSLWADEHKLTIIRIDKK